MTISLLLLAACLGACNSNPSGGEAEQSKSAALVPDGPRRTVDAARAMQYVKDQVAYGRRAMGSPGHKKVQDYILEKLKGDEVSQDNFKTKTPQGEFEFSNIIAKYPGTKDGLIIIASHYDTKYTPKDFVGANDGGSSTGLLLELANQFRGNPNPGPAVWLVFFDGEEAFGEWSDSDSTYGSRHLANLWDKDGTAKKIKAFILLDMIGDKDLGVIDDTASDPVLRQMLYESATALNQQTHFSVTETPMEDDHTPFHRLGVPVLDIIDFDYGKNNEYWHTNKDTVDKLSDKSLGIVGDVTLELVRRLNAR